MDVGTGGLAPSHQHRVRSLQPYCNGGGAAWPSAFLGTLAGTKLEVQLRPARPALLPSPTCPRRLCSLRRCLGLPEPACRLSSFHDRTGVRHFSVSSSQARVLMTQYCVGRSYSGNHSGHEFWSAAAMWCLKVSVPRLLSTLLLWCSLSCGVRMSMSHGWLGIKNYSVPVF